MQTILENGPQELTDIFLDEEYVGLEDYRRQLKNDMEWLQHRTPSLQGLPTPQEHFSRWCDWARQHGKRWKRACKHALRQDGQEQQLAALQESLMPARDSLITTAAVQDNGNGMEYCCEICGKSCVDATALAVHKQLLHGVSAPARAFMPLSTTCCSCLRDYRTTQRLRQHLQ